MSDEPAFSVVLHHLAPGAKEAGAAFPDAELPGVSNKKLRELIRALGALAPANLGTAAPELRVTAPQGQFVVQIAQGRLRINSWTIKVGGADLSPDQIFSLITGADAVAEGSGVAVEVAGPKRARGPLIVLLAVLIVGSNAVTAWMLTRPPPPVPLLPSCTPLARESGERLFSTLTGEYQTGTTEGARALKISKDGHVHWLHLGAAGATAEDSELSVRPVQVNGRPGLLADERAVIEVADTGALTFYNQTYRRKSP